MRAAVASASPAPEPEPSAAVVAANKAASEAVPQRSVLAAATTQPMAGPPPNVSAGKASSGASERSRIPAKSVSSPTPAGSAGSGRNLAAVTGVERMPVVEVTVLQWTTPPADWKDDSRCRPDIYERLSAVPKLMNFTGTPAEPGAVKGSAVARDAPGGVPPIHRLLEAVSGLHLRNALA